mgnify:CR=1 FL=1
MTELGLLLISYIFGSISSAIIICKVMGIPDPRYNGSNNPGATNVKRLGGNKAAIFVLIGDISKGLFPVLIAIWFKVSDIILAGVCLSVFIGHLYPIFFKFSGGKGVATAIGVLFGLHVIIGLIIAALWIIIAKVTKISSLSAIISMTFSPIALWLIRPSIELVIMQIIVSLMLIWRHKENISNLMMGKESKIKK